MIEIANAPCSWGVLEFDLAGSSPDYAQVLDEMRETGYVGTELGDWGFMPTDPTRLARELKALNFAGPVMFEYENHPENPVPDMKQGLANWRKAWEAA